MIPLADSHVLVQGNSYALQPCSTFYWDRLAKEGAVAAERLEKGKIDQFEYWNILLKLIVKDEPGWDVTHKDFDGREAENAILSFVPPSMQARVLLTGWQSF